MTHKYKPMTDEGAMLLSAAITEAAVDDWRFLIRTGRDASSLKGRVISTAELRAFFHGPLFKSMTDVLQVDHEKAVAKLENEMEKGIEGMGAQ